MRNEQNKARKQGESKAKTRGKDCARSAAAASRDLVRVFSTANERLLDLAPFDLAALAKSIQVVRNILERASLSANHECFVLEAVLPVPKFVCAKSLLLEIAK